MSDQVSSTGSGKPWSKTVLAIVAAANLAAGAIGGALLTDFTGFREKQTEAAIAAVAAARDADQELNPLLVKFAKLALGEGSVSQEDRLEFDKIINKVDQKAATIKQIYPDTTGFYENYSNSLIALKQSADKLKGPYTGREFVKAVDKYAVSRDEFQEAAQRAGSGYLRSFKM